MTGVGNPTLKVVHGTQPEIGRRGILRGALGLLAAAAVSRPTSVLGATPVKAPFVFGVGPLDFLTLMRDAFVLTSTALSVYNQVKRSALHAERLMGEAGDRDAPDLMHIVEASQNLVMHNEEILTRIRNLGIVIREQVDAAFRRALMRELESELASFKIMSADVRDRDREGATYIRAKASRLEDLASQIVLKDGAAAYPVFCVAIAMAYSLHEAYGTRPGYLINLMKRHVAVLDSWLNPAETRSPGANLMEAELVNDRATVLSERPLQPVPIGESVRNLDGYTRVDRLLVEVQGTRDGGVTIKTFMSEYSNYFGPDDELPTRYQMPSDQTGLIFTDLVPEKYKELFDIVAATEPEAVSSDVIDYRADQILKNAAQILRSFSNYYWGDQAKHNRKLQELRLLRDSMIGVKTALLMRAEFLEGYVQPEYLLPSEVPARGQGPATSPTTADPFSGSSKSGVY